MQAYWLVVRVLLTPPAEAAASQKWKIIYLQVLKLVFTVLLLCRRFCERGSNNPDGRAGEILRPASRRCQHQDPEPHLYAYSRSS